MTFAACETVDDPVVVTAEALSEAPPFGSLPFGSVPGVADPLDGGGTSLAAEPGATSAADGGTEPTDAVAEALVTVGDDGAEGA